MKKILSMLLSLALVSASFVTAMAEGKPYVSYEISKVDYAADVLLAAELVAEEDLAELAGADFYEVVVSLNNLPDLTYASKSGNDGTRLALSSYKFYTDLNNIKGVWGVNTDEAELLDEVSYPAGLLDTGLLTFSLNSIDGSITVMHEPGTKKTNCFPTAKADQDLDADGTLEGVVVFYVAAVEEPVFTAALTDANIVVNNDFVNLESSLVKEFFGAAEEYVNSDNSYNVGVEASIDDVTSPVSEATFDFVAADGTAADYTIGFTTVESGSVKVALNITNVPAGKTFQFVGSTLK